MRRLAVAGLAAVAIAVATAPARADVAEPWRSAAEESVVELVTTDADGAARDTKVWIVVVDGTGFVRTNDSRWLANIRRGSSIVLRLDATDRPVTSEEVTDPAVTTAVERAFKAKYGVMQRVMSALRTREPTVLRLRQRES